MVPTDDESLFQRALELDESEQTSEAIRLLEPLVAPRDNPRYLSAYALFLQRSNRPVEAIEALECALNIEPHYREGDMRLLLADLLLGVDRKQDAIAQWKIVPGMEPNGDPFASIPYEAIARLNQYDV